MSTKRQLPFVGLVALLLTACGLLVFDLPHEPVWGAIFAGCVLVYSGWLTLRDLQGPDEVRSAAMRFGLIFGSWLGLAIAVMTVMMMLAAPGFADFLTNVAVPSTNRLSPANVGYAYGVLFTVGVMMVSTALGYTGWWLTRR